MDIFALFESIAQGRHIGKMRGKAQFDLAIVGRQYDIAGFRDKCIPYLTPRLGPNGNILQIGVR